VKLRLINAAEVRRLLPMEPCIDLMRTAMTLEAQGKAIQPIRTGIPHPNGRGLMGMMPGHIAEPDWLGIKVVTVYPGNFGTDLGSHQGVVMLFEPQNGTPVAIMEAREITAIRTAAATAAATDVLARQDARSLAVFGYGEQAHTHLQALPCVRKFDRIVLWGRDPEKTAAFCRQQSERLGREIEPVASAAEAVDVADVLCTATAAPEPFLQGTWLKPGQHLNVVGSSIPTTSEIDVEAVVRSRFFVDFRDSAMALAGDFRRAKAAGAVTDAHMLGTVGNVLAGQIPGRTGAEDITLFKSLGMVAEDLVSADFILKEAMRLGVGVEVDW
jgi:ornithine cyclodeaminase/alanine dehydrogenase-like protein (mu-crystallin family)